jgi:hypothetical protein
MERHEYLDAVGAQRERVRGVSSKGPSLANPTVRLSHGNPVLQGVGRRRDARA